MCTKWLQGKSDNQLKQPDKKLELGTSYKLKLGQSGKLRIGHDCVALHDADTNDNIHDCVVLHDANTNDNMTTSTDFHSD